MKTLLAVVSVGLMASGCASVDERFTAQPQHPSVVLTWRVVDDANRECRQLGAQVAAGMKILGCATFAGRRCEVITSRDTSHAVLGHEVRHCFEGKFHD